MDINQLNEPKPRLVYLDNLRVLFVIWVVFHHALRAYAPWWHYAVNEQEQVDVTIKVIINPFSFGKRNNLKLII